MEKRKKLIQGELELIYYMLYIDSEWVATIHKFINRYHIETEFCHHDNLVLKSTNLQDAKKDTILFVKKELEERLLTTKKEKKKRKILYRN